ncbi:MAG: HD domain-containing protein [Ignavibacteriales bacterium]|nr:HD domain-containing protein [Ignavibacteriales bacterium]
MKRTIDLGAGVLETIGAVADRERLEAYVVGGFVRDALLGTQGKDVDIVVLGDGIAFAGKVAEELGNRSLVTFPKFGTAMLPYNDGKIEFVGARQERYEPGSRKPSVETGTLKDDLLRRDFTVNAMAAALNSGSRGMLADPLGGRKDLKAKILRTPLDPVKTFDDDPLRILRAMRFAAQLEFRIDPAALRAATDMRDRLGIVSQERISEEFLKLLSAPQPSTGLFPMQETGLMNVVFPEIAALSGVEQRKEYHHKDVFLHTLKVVDNISRETGNVWLRMAALLHDIAKPRTKAFKEGTGWTFHGHEEIGARMVKPIFRRMKFPLEHVLYVEKIVRLHLRPMALVDEEVKDSAVRRLLFEAGEDIDDLMKLCRADITSKNPRLVRQVRQNYEMVARKMAEVEEKDRMRNWRPALNGDEIMEACGIGPGPLVGKLKQAVVDAILDGHIPNDHDAALQYLHSIKNKVLE